MHLQKLLTFFFSKNTCELDIVLIRSVNILTTNELIKLKILKAYLDTTIVCITFLNHHSTKCRDPK